MSKESQALKMAHIPKEKPHFVDIWNDSDQEADDQTPEEIVKQFVDAKNIFDPPLSWITNYVENMDNPLTIDTRKVEDLEEDQQLLKRKQRRDNSLLAENERGFREMNDSIANDEESHAGIPVIPNVGNSQIDQSIGPQPIKVELDKKEEKKFYAGIQMNLTEAQLLAQYVQQGKRIPRRGEVGLSSNEIEKFESLGYVMSGSRHTKMNNIRRLKEGMVYSAEDKRALAIFNRGEQLRKEKNIISGFKVMMKHQTKPENPEGKK